MKGDAHVVVEVPVSTAILRALPAETVKREIGELAYNAAQAAAGEKRAR